VTLFLAGLAVLVGGVMPQAISGGAIQGQAVPLPTATAQKVEIGQPFRVRFAKSLTGRSVTVWIDGKIENTFAGKLGFQEENTSWQSVCAAVKRPIVAGQFFGLRAARSEQVGGNIAKAGNIVAHYFTTARTADQCAGLQLAVWEAIEDGNASPDFLGGHFQVKTTPAVMAYALAYYKGGVDNPGKATYLIATNTEQDQLTTTAQSVQN